MVEFTITKFFISALLIAITAGGVWVSRNQAKGLGVMVPRCLL